MRNCLENVRNCAAGYTSLADACLHLVAVGFELRRDERGGFCLLQRQLRVRMDFFEDAQQARFVCGDLFIERRVLRGSRSEEECAEQQGESEGRFQCSGGWVEMTCVGF